MTVFIESPWPWLLLGIAAEAVLAVALLRTQRGNVLWAMLGVGLFVLLGLVAERFIVTDRKAVMHTLDAAVAAARANDLSRVLDCISPQARKARDYARWVFDRAQIEEAHIHELEITFNRLTSPPTARASFLAVGRAQDRRGEVPYQGFARRVVVELRWEGNRWLATDCTMEDFEPPRP